LPLPTLTTVEGLALSQEGNPQTHSGTLHGLQHIFNWIIWLPTGLSSTGIYIAAEVHVGLLQASTTC